MFDDKTLISLVEKYPLLYDLTSPLYCDHTKKEEAWNEIAKSMSSAAHNCKVKWTRLRDNFRKALLLRRKAPSDRTRAVKYEKEMSFLKTNFSERKKNNLEIEFHLNRTLRNKAIDDKRNLNTKRPLAPHLVTSIESTSTEPSTNDKDEVAPVDDINKFFESIAETVKKFPKMMQVNLKRQIFNTVNEMEVALLANENSPYDKSIYMISPMSASMSSQMPTAATLAGSNAPANTDNSTISLSNLGYVTSSMLTPNENSQDIDNSDLKTEQSDINDIKIEPSDSEYVITIHEEILP